MTSPPTPRKLVPQGRSGEGSAHLLMSYVGDEEMKEMKEMKEMEECKNGRIMNYYDAKDFW